MAVNHDLNLKKLPPELKLILKILSSGETRDEPKMIIENINWDKFLELAMHHRLFPILYLKMKHMHSSAPVYVIKALKQAYISNSFEMLKLTAEMKKISQLLNDTRLLFLKGPVLAIDLYNDLSLRTSCDLDILVPLTDLNKVEKVLIDAGYEKDEYIHSILGDWKWRHHHFSYFHPEKMIKLEIHWRMNPGPGLEPTFDSLWERKRRSSIIDDPIYFLGIEDLFLFLVSHGARHGWSRLRWLMDIQRILMHKIDWRKLSHLLHRYGYYQLGGQAIILASNLMSVNIQGQMEKMVSGKRALSLAQQAIYYMETMVNLHSELLPDEISAYHRRHLYSQMSMRQRLLYILSLSFPYYTDLKTMPLPKPLHVLYFPLRPLLGALRKSKKQARLRGRKL